jgi:hypothetical protein
LPQYQTFPDAKGHSDSAAKLKALRLPGRLNGKSVLDIACNEGFFCQEAWRRGAARVVGLDRHADFIARARARDSATEYVEMDWTRLSELTETFDVVLLLSALHYAQDPEALLRLAFDRVSPNGILLVECGVAPGGKPEWRRIDRPRGDSVLHPTRAMMSGVLPDAVMRLLGPSIEQPGDPLPRVVYRATRRKPVVLLVEGDSGTGKSTLTRLLLGEGHAGVSLDHMLWTLESWCDEPRLRALRAQREFKPNQIRQIGEVLVEAGAADLFAEEVLANRAKILARRPVTVIEGHVLGLGDVAAAFARRLTEGGTFVWHVAPSEVRPGLLGGVRRVRR